MREGKRSVDGITEPSLRKIKKRKKKKSRGGGIGLFFLIHL